MATLAAVTNMPALALLGEDGRLEQSTEPFRRWYRENEELCKQSPEFGRVLDGQANAAVLKLDGIAVDIAAVSDRSGARHVLLTLPTEELPSLGDAGGALLDGALDESPAIVWLKDLEGRYVRANSRFTTLLGTTEERLLGRTDAELEPAETVDGPRLQEREGDVQEPLQLEYFVGPYQGRDALVVLRFPVGDAKGVPTLVCGVAAPSSEANVARGEAARLLRIERWSRLDAESVRAEMLAEWGVLPDARGRAAPTATGGEPVTVAPDREQQAAVAEARAERATAVAERDAALSANEELGAQLDAAKGRLTDLERKIAAGDVERGDTEVALAAQAADLERALGRERERAEELERTLGLVRERLGDDAEAARTEVKRARADADAARSELERARTDAEAARADVDKARAEAEAARTAVVAERESASSARSALELELKQAREQVAVLERRHSADDSGAQLIQAEKARAAAEAALAQAVAERDATLKASAALTGELEQERKQIAALQDGAAAAEGRIRELTGDVERERVRVAGLEQAQAGVQELEGELRAAITRADNAERDVELAATAADKAENQLQFAVARADKADGELQLAVARADKAEGELRVVGARVVKAESEAQAASSRAAKAEEEVERWRGRVEKAEEEIERWRARVDKAEGDVEQWRARVDKAGNDIEQWRTRAEQAETELARGSGRVEGLDGELARGQTRIEQLEAELKLVIKRADDAERAGTLGQARVVALESEVERERAEAFQLETAVEREQARVVELESEIEHGQARVVELETEVERGQARTEELEGELESTRAKADDAETTIAELQGQLAELEEQLATRAAEPIPAAEEGGVVEADEAGAAASSFAEPADAEEEPVAEEVSAVEPEPVLADPTTAQPPSATELATLEAVAEANHAQAGPGVSWQPTAKRTLAASLARESVWRNVLKETVQVIGSEGGWDTVTAWLPDESDGLGCAATWTAHGGLDRFEALTWDAGVKRDGSLLDQALQAPHLTWLTDIDAVDDERLQTAAAHGMSSALLLPVRSGTSTIGLLELLTHDSIEPNAQIALSLEASALQLGRFGHLLSLGK
ncbi:MAG TPA: PAS domain-containing protein [Solirubrobacteraceae bacterium]|nr:PAS domain-containing protein [Solirubrobacteraceae bacterium]